MLSFLFIVAAARSATAQLTPPGQRLGPGPGTFPASVSVKVEPESVKAGDIVKLEVAVTLDPGYHTYDLEQPDLPAVASQITLDVKDPLEPLGGWIGTPAEEKLDEILKKRILVHHVSATWWHEIQVALDAAPGEYKIAGKLRITVCDEKGCLPPKTEKFEVTVNVEAASAKGEPASPHVAPKEARGEPAQTNPVMDSEATRKSTSTAKEGAAPPPTLPKEFTTVHTDFQVENVWVALAAGLLAGLILNVMPCVLPVISLKIYGYVKQAGEDRGRIRAMGFAFSAGILFVFLIFGVLFAYAGQTWGELFQSDTFNVIMVAVLVGCTLWMFDVFLFTVPGVVSAADAAAAARKDLVGEFAKGMLATLLSTPCSGPLLIPVISFALKSQSPPIIFSTLTAIGVGMGFPYVLLAWNPGWMKIMPKPGEWMRTFKEFMGFLLLGTAVWLLWQRRKNGDLVVWTVAFSTFVGLAGWLYGRWSDPMKSRAKRLAAPLVALLLIAFGAYFSFIVMYEPPIRTTNYQSVAQVDAASREADGSNPKDYHWKPFDLHAVLAARAKGRTVVVDWTADW